MALHAIPNGPGWKLDTLENLFPNVSHPSHDYLASVGCYEVHFSRDYDPAVQTLSACLPYLDGGAVFTVEAVDLTTDQLAAKAAAVVAKANAVIAAQLAALDLKRIRPAAEGDTEYLATLNAEAIALRARLQ